VAAVSANDEIGADLERAVRRLGPLMAAFWLAGTDFPSLWGK